MKYIITLIIILTPILTQASIFSEEEWAAKYLSPCPKIPDNRVCKSKTKRNLKRMLKHKAILFKYLDKYNLPRWLGVICIIESECYDKATSRDKKTQRILAVGFMQIAPVNLIYYSTKTRGPINGHYVITKPTRAKAIEIGYDLEKNIEISCKILRYLYDKYGKNQHETVLRAYNAGETRIDRAMKGLGSPLKPQTLNYYFQLLALKNILEGYSDYFSD
jgi:hypothetical protein